MESVSRVGGNAIQIEVVGAQVLTHKIAVAAKATAGHERVRRPHGHFGAVLLPCLNARDGAIIILNELVGAGLEK